MYLFSAAEDFLAGTLSGIVTTIIGHPFDTIKVQKILDPIFF